MLICVFFLNVSAFANCISLVKLILIKTCRLKGLAEGGLDPASILKLEEEKRQRQREEELLRIQEKHLSALLTRENAFIAKQSLLNDTKVHAESVRKEVMCSNVLLSSGH